MAVGSREGLPPGIEHRVAQFAELVSTAISNIESRAKVDRLVAEQAALRRVAEFVAAQPPSERVFELVTEELSHLLEVSIVGTLRFEPDGSATILAVLSTAEPLVPGTVVPPSGGVLDQILDTGRPARVDDFEQVGAPTDALMRQIGVRCAAGGPIVVDGLLWGAMVVASETANALPAGAEDRVAQFAELVSTAISNVESRAKVEQLAGEQAALRRVATLVAEGAAPSRVFDAVRAEVEQMFGGPNTILMRFDPDGMATLLATPGNYLAAVGTQWPLEGDDSAVARVYGTGHAARADYTAGAVGPLAEAARLGGTLFPVAVPVVVDGALWGAMSVGSRGPDPPPSDLEGRLAKFTELLATAIANAESRADLAASEALARELASEQAALRRVATIVAEGASPGELFSALAEEVGVLLDVDAASILRYETDSTTTVIAGWSDGAIQLPLGERLPLDGDNLAAEVLRTGKPRRKNDYVGAPGRIAATVRELGVHSAVASPIVVEGAIWGVVGVLSRKPEPLPSDTEARLAEFSRHAGIAVANAKSRSDLAESRARIVRAGDEARRRFERDLHDGAQQRLVSLGLGLRAAEASIPPELHDLRRVLSGLGTGLTEVLDDLRELSRGLHPAVLSEDGLDPALRSLALRSAVPVELRIDLDNERFEAPVEAAAYYVASEALTNVAKHADASRAQVRVSRCEGWLDLVVSDDGSGGADASSGSGLTGLLDRVEAIGGTIQIESPRDAGTAIHVRLPIGSTR
jgi:signal transduction histidine kinase